MILTILVVFFNLFVNVFDVLLIIRIVMSWIVPDLKGNVFGRLMVDLTEPVLAPVRKILPKGGMFDLAPIATVIILYLLQTLVASLLIH